MIFSSTVCFKNIVIKPKEAQKVYPLNHTLSIHLTVHKSKEYTCNTYFGNNIYVQMINFF